MKNKMDIPTRTWIIEYKKTSLSSDEISNTWIMRQRTTGFTIKLILVYLPRITICVPHAQHHISEGFVGMACKQIGERDFRAEKKKNEDDPKSDNQTPGMDDDTSMTTLILWNISKALQRNPHLDLKLAIKNIHERLGNTRDVNKIMTHSPEERHLACALLAWHELGYDTAESLYTFIEDKYGDQERDKGEQTDDMKAEPKEIKDEPIQTQTVKVSNLEQKHGEPIDTHNMKVESIENADKTKHAQSIKTSIVEQHRSEYLQYPIYSNIKEKPKESAGTPIERVITANFEHQRSDSLRHPIFDHTENKECKFCPAKVPKTEVNSGNYGKFCCNVYREEGETFKTSISKCVKDNKKEESSNCTFVTTSKKPAQFTKSGDQMERDSHEGFDTCSLRGPVVTLPPDTKVVMRLDNNQSTCARHQGKKPRGQEKDVMRKIDAACCMDSACAERLKELDKATAELRNRAACLARREAERAELLERAEAAWRDLELGYQRRLTLAEEKEFDMVKQAKKLLEDRNGYKAACMNLAKLLKERGDMTEKNREELVQVEKEMCGLACTRMHLSEQAARSNAAITEQHIKVSQLDRDLNFKAEEKRRKLSSTQSDVESVRALTVEAERAMRAELCAIREQVDNVSNQLLREDDDTMKIKVELDALREEKANMVQDLEGCQVSCDARMQKKMDELKKSRERLEQLKEKVIKCQCKVPIDAAVEVKRTPSLAALCACSPEDRLLESCSCTSLRSQLISNLLADLFGGLQGELGDVGIQMPCQFLKCLEDKHNWDRGSLVKTNLRTFFSQLLVGELDIAIATSIEKYHARWVGATCADTLRMIPEPSQAIVDDWQQVQERAIERRAQKLANKLAEQLFKERADQLVQRAKDAVKADPPACECKDAAVFPCLVNPPLVGGEGFSDNKGVAPTYWRRTIKDVTQLRVQIENLKKESLKKEDLKRVEEKISKLVQRPSEPEPPILSKENNARELIVFQHNSNKNIKNQYQSVNTEVVSQLPRSIRKKLVEGNSTPKRNVKKVLSDKQDRLNKNVKKLGLIREFAVNTCFCGNQSTMPKLIGDDQSQKQNTESEDKSLRKQTFPKNMSEQVSGLKHTKPISGNVLESALPDYKKNKSTIESSCREGCVCFHKIPSNSSIDKLLEKLTKWKSDLTQTSQEPIEKNIMTNDKVISNQKQDNKFKSENGTQSNIPYQAIGFEISSNNVNYNKSTDMDNSTNMLPNTTDSEYMGAVNLDKSNDHCNCTVKIHNDKKLKRNKNGAKVKDSLFKCINSELCECKKSLDSKNESINIHNKNSRQDSLKKNFRENNLLLESQSKKRNLKLTNTDQLDHQASNVNESSKNVEDDKPKDETKPAINRVVKPSDLPCDCDYYVKLLGVTLSDISSHKVFDDKLAISDRKHKTETSLDSNGQGITNKSSKSKQDENSLNIQCQCHVKFDEFKNYMENNFKKQWGAKDDKELDVQSFQEHISNNEEACVCCNKCPINESEELEVNTFYLLEEHLRGKLQELKKSCCKFSSLPAEEEENLFSAILERVRKIISSSTNELTCKCMCKDQNQTDGSWNRANTLLQEYLKTKIKKVQCFCGNVDQKQECILPKVLDEIYYLIEKDFQRLRNVCNSQTTNNNDQNKGEIPEKDTNESHSVEGKCKNIPYIGKDIDKLSKLNSNKSMILTQSMSAQVPHNLEMITKSVDAMEKGTKNVQTSESMISVSRKCLETENCGCDFVINNSKYGAQEVIVNHHMTSVINNKEITNTTKKIDSDNKLKPTDKFNDQYSSPYIGYTIDCACKCALGTCTCVKSSVTGNNKLIKNIWKDLTIDNRQSQDVSYIMDSISENPKNDPVDIPEQAVKTTNSNQTSRNNESDFSDEDIVLKDSKRNVVVSNHSANTASHDKFVDDYSAKAEEKYHICDGCRVSKPILKNSIRSESHLPHSTIMHKTQSLNCGCTMVPICHVKMLVDNIENRLYHAKCICDSFNPRVCPIHSKSYY